MTKEEIEQIYALRPVGIEDAYEELFQWILRVRAYRMEQAGKLMAELMEKSLKYRDV